MLLAAASGGDATHDVARAAGDAAGAAVEAGVDERERGAGTAQDGTGADFNDGAGIEGRGKEEAGAGARADEEEDAEDTGETDNIEWRTAAGKRPRVLGGVRGSPVAPLNAGGGVAVQRGGTSSSVTPPREGLEKTPDAKWARMRDGVSSVGVAMAPLSAARSPHVRKKAGPQQPRARGKKGKGVARGNGQSGMMIPAEPDEKKKNRGNARPGAQNKKVTNNWGWQQRYGTSNIDGGGAAGRWGRQQIADDEGKGGRGRAREHGCTSAATAYDKRTYPPRPQSTAYTV